jgi:hypothetical protein
MNVWLLQVSFCAKIFFVCALVVNLYEKNSKKKLMMSCELWSLESS